MQIPNFEFERDLWKKNVRYIGGVDEVGRGSLAGPVVTGCVIFSEDVKIEVTLNDSKKLTQKQREKADIWIKKNALAYGIGSATVAQINKLGIVAAANIAFRSAIKNCFLVDRKTIQKVDFLLIDAFYLPYVKGIRRKNQLAIVKGDSKSVSIAAASIIAKVYRDEIMTKLGNKPKYKKYLWHKNKGYGTLDHRKAIQKHGITRLHRKLFVRKITD